MILRVGLAIRDKNQERTLSDQLIAWSLSSVRDGDIEVDLALLQDNFERLREIYPHLDLAFISYDMLGEHRDRLSELRRRNPACVPVPVGETVAELRSYLSIRPGGLLLRPWAAGEVDELCRICSTELAGSRDVLQIKTRQGCRALSAASILFCQSDKKYVSLVSEGGDAFRRLGKLDDLAGLLPDYFVRVHQSFLVNFRRVTALDRVTWEVVLDTGDRVPVSRTYRESTGALFQKCLLSV